MKKWLVILLALLLCAPAFADSDAQPGETAAPEAGDVELSGYIGMPFDDLYADIGGDLDRHFFPDGATVYLHWMVVSTRHTYPNAEEKYGWEDGTVFYLSLSEAGYSLNGIKVGDTEESIRAFCDGDGWTELETAPKYCDFGYEKTVDGVRYTMGFILEYGEDYINLVFLQGEKLD